MDRIYRLVALSASLGMLGGSTLFGQTPVTEAAAADSTPSLSSLDVRASQYPSSSKDRVSIDRDAQGRTVAVWQSRRQQEGTYGIYARRFDADGTPMGDEVQINQTSAGHQMAPTVALDADGTAWFVWQSSGQDGDASGVFARRFDAELLRSSAEVLVNEERAGNQTLPCVASDSSGRAVVVWQHEDRASGRQSTRARRLATDGKCEGAAFEVESHATFSSNTPGLCMAPDGSFAVTWARVNESGDPQGIWCRQFDGKGVALEEFKVSGEGQNGIEPVLACVNEARLVASWLEGHDGDYRIAFRSMERMPDGQVQLSEISRLAIPESGYISGLTVAARSNGDLALAWNLYQTGGKHHSDVYLATWDRTGQVLREPFLAHQESAGHQHLSPARGTRSLVFGEDGSLVLGWSGDAGLGDHKAAHLSFHAAPGQVLTATETLEISPIRWDLPAKPHEPPTFTPPEDLPELQRLPVFHAQTGGIGFDGISNTGWGPPDPELAVGPEHLVAMTNGAISFFDKNGAQLFTDQIEGGNGFWGNQGATNFVFDPEVRFDPHSDRFFAMANERGSNGKPYFLLAVSDDSNPVGAWHKYRFDVQTEAGDTDIDSPNMGIDSEAVYLTADFFGPDKFLVYIIEKAQILNGGTANTTSTVVAGRQSMGLPLMYGTSPRQYMVWAPETSSANNLRIYAINNPLTNPSLVSTTVTIPVYTQPENPPQMGTSVRPETFEARVWSATYRNGSLWATHHAGSSRILQRWYEIDMANWPVSGTPTLVQTGIIDPGPGIRTYFGSIAVDDQGNMGMTFSRSSSSEFISMGFTSRAAGDPLGTTQPMVIAKNSTVADNSGRWGDYSGIAADPGGGSEFWAVHEYRSGGWRTWIQSFRAVDGPTNFCATSPNSMGSGALISSTGSTGVGANDLVLTVSGAPSSVQGLFFFGPNEVQNPFGNGQLCVGGAIQRLPVTGTDNSGSASLALDINGPHVGGSIVIGTTMKFQYWYRDPGFGQNFNLSDGLSATFTP